VRGDVFGLARLEIEHVDVLVETGVSLLNDETVVTGRPARQREPAVACIDQFRVVTCSLAVLDVDVEDGVVAAVRSEGEALALAVPAAPPVLGVWPLGAIGDFARLRVEGVELCALVAALVFPEHEFRPFGGVVDEGDAVLVEGALDGPLARPVESPHLGRAGRVHQEREALSVRGERPAVSAPDVEIALDVVRCHGSYFVSPNQGSSGRGNPPGRAGR